ncbi:MAG: MMPL family transporter [Prevotella sp.]|nr:MMPL family transporter [Prevotella sp.]
MRWGFLLISTIVLLCLVMRLSYKEDISDFLSLTDDDRKTLVAYQEMSGADRIFVKFQTKQPKKLITSLFIRNVEKRDTAGWTRGRLQTEIGMDEMLHMQDLVYSYVPYLLTDADYLRMDSLLADTGYIEQQIDVDKDKMMYPVPLITNSVKNDPLSLFLPVMLRLREAAPDTTQTMVILKSPFGNAETEKNAQLITLLDSAIADVQAMYPDTKAHIIGGPVIAVGNAKQIKQDSVIAISIATVLILAVLLWYFRSIKSIMLIALSVGWGWLFALGGMAMIHSNVSIIVLGMSSVILGIAVNYPLHLIAHVRHTNGDMRQTLREIIKPLLVGNITTIGAFMALIPLQSAALRDLGIFAALQLLGTIIFVLVFLPHWNTKISHLSSFSLPFSRPYHRILAPLLLFLTLLFAWFSLDVKFDSDISHINYMTDEQRKEMQSFDLNVFKSKQQQEQRIARWETFVQQHKKDFGGKLTTFKKFQNIINNHYETHELGSVETLSDNFNYIGIVCSTIVFLFLWLSFRKLSLAIISFLPMAVSWIWILGIMSILNIQFNIVNIILATFTFGQGDDYTIFVTEGCRYESTHGKPMLRNYLSGILLSAVLMFIGIGTLIFAKHPALHSLAEVTIIGMICVVLMAWVIPPLLFHLFSKPKFSKLLLMTLLLVLSDVTFAEPVKMQVYLPKDYDRDTLRSYPVLYLLHGSGGDETSWNTDGHATEILDSMISEGVAVPMIVVMPNGGGFTSSFKGKIESDFPEKVMQYVEKHYRTVEQKKGRAIAGLSLGGFQTLIISANNPDKFDYIGLFSPQTTNKIGDKSISSIRDMKGGLRSIVSSIPFFGSNWGNKIDKKFEGINNLEAYEKLDAKLHEQFTSSPPKLYYIAVGREDFIKKLVDMHRERLDKAGYKYYYNETDGGHTWDNWRSYLKDFLPRIFK